MAVALAVLVLVIVLVLVLLVLRTHLRKLPQELGLQQSSGGEQAVQTNHCCCDSFRARSFAVVVVRVVPLLLRVLLLPTQLPRAERLQALGE